MKLHPLIPPLLRLTFLAAWALLLWLPAAWLPVSVKYTALDLLVVLAIVHSCIVHYEKGEKGLRDYFKARRPDPTRICKNCACWERSIGAGHCSFQRRFTKPEGTCAGFIKKPPCP